VGYVYLIWAKGTSDFKIGVTKDLKARLSTLQTANANALEIVASIECADPERKEAYLHEKYREFARSGEWFSVPPWAIAELLADFAIDPVLAPDTPVFMLLAKIKRLQNRVRQYQSRLKEQATSIGELQGAVAAFEARQDIETR
jgi:hypothetical protein